MIVLGKKYYFLNYILIFSLLISCGIKKQQSDLPDISKYSIDDSKRIEINDSLFFKGNSSLRKNDYEQIELVAFGNPLDMGNTIGELSKELILKQEEIFFSKVEELVPSKFKQSLLRKFLATYNRKLDLHIKEEYKAEIYGISKYSSDKYNFIAQKYLRSLYLHGAHDIGHALKDLALVGCTSFAVWGDKSEDGNLLIARNFDFYMSDEFAKEKVISFIQPEKGYKFMSVSWAGMIGVMSGMNDQGLTVTINAGKSDIPFIAKTPISLVAREIVQYASNIEEAIKIAKQKEVFVSESIMVGSINDNKAILIEISPDKFDVYNIENSTQLICSNHFQSDIYKSDKKNIKHIEQSHSKYRFDRMEELLGETKKINPKKAVSILRNKDGLNNSKIGYGNEKALNQLLAHHGIVFQPNKKMVWVSSNPYQLGEFVAFQLDSVFNNFDKQTITLSLPQYLIEKDSFITSEEFANYEKYRIERINIEKVIIDKGNLSIDRLEYFKSLNPDSWDVYFLVGKYYYQKRYYSAALNEFEEALLKEITTQPEKEIVEDYIKKIKRK
jgi:hypothetical protein